MEALNREFPLFTDLLVIVGASLVVLFLFRRLRLPPIAGFILTGVLIGPSGLGWVQRAEHVNIAAEIGIVLLLFMIGLEVSFSRLVRTSWRLHGLAVLQVLGTAVVGFLGGEAIGLDPAAALITGFILSVSSSAIVLKGLADRGELESPLGRMVVTTCLVQDFAVVPMLLIIGFLGSGGSAHAAFGQTVLRVAAAGGILYLAARYIVPPLMNRLMAINTSEVVLLFAALLMLGAAWLTSLAGLSLAIGAFAAGLILSDTQYNAQVYAEVAPFRTLFTSLFFVAIGMLLDLRFVLAHPLPVLAVALAVLLIKTVVVVIAGVPLGIPTRLAMQGGFYIAQIGEFSFLLIAAAASASLLTEPTYQYLMAAASLTMAVTPFIMHWAPQVAWRAGVRLPWFADLHRGGVEEGISPRPKPAVLIVGHGVNGENVSRVLREAGIHYEVLEFNPDIVRQVRAAGGRVHYGDVTRAEVLKQLDVTDFDSVVLAISDPAATRRAVSVLRALHPHVYLLVRTRYVAEVEELEKLGANLVVPEEFETSLRIFSDLLHHYRVPPHIIAMQIEAVRGHSYSLLRARADVSVIQNIEELLLQRLVEAVPVQSGSPVIGRTIGDLDLHEQATCLVLSILRAGHPVRPPFESVVLQPDDLVVLYGSHVDLNRAVGKLTGRG